MNTYIGTKIINAKPMTRQAYNDLRGWTVPADENPADDGYLVEYHDGGQSNHPDFKGHISWSPKDVFERSYRPTTGLTFGMAIEAVKAGKSVTREAWSITTGAIIKMVGDELIIVSTFWLDGSVSERHINGDDLDKHDLLAEDWKVVL